MKRKQIVFVVTAGFLLALFAEFAIAQDTSRRALPAPSGIPAPGPTTDAPYVPQPILAGGVIVPLYAPGSPLLKMDRVREAEKYNMRPVGHTTLNVGPEGADFVPFFYNYGVTTIILRNRLRVDGYDVRKDELNDALQSIRLVRAYAKEWNIDPNRIGIMGFSAGGELAAPAAVLYDDFDSKNDTPGDPLAGITSRPDFVCLVYPGGTPFSRNRTPPPIPRNVPPTFVVTAGSGDQGHAISSVAYFSAMLEMGVPNIEMHIYGNGRHAGGLSDRNDIPFGTWQQRYVDWFRDLGFLQKPGIETKAAKDSAAFVIAPAKPANGAAPSPK